MTDISQNQEKQTSLPTTTPPVHSDEVVNEANDALVQIMRNTVPSKSGQGAVTNNVQVTHPEQRDTTPVSVPGTDRTDDDTQHLIAQPKDKSSETHQTLGTPTPNAIVTKTQPDAQGRNATTDVSHSGPVKVLSPQEITLAELKAQKAALLASLATLPAIQVLMEEKASSGADMSDGDDEPTEADITAAANKIVKDHIKLLHEYNELKDVGQGLMGLIADQRGVRIVEVQDEFGIDAKD